MKELATKVKKQSPEVFSQIDMSLPAEVTEAFWIYAYNGKAKSGETLGKWCTFAEDVNTLTEMWLRIRETIQSEEGLDCVCAKVSTMHPERTHAYTIAVYTNNDNVDLIGQQLCNILPQTMWVYKVDAAKGSRFWKEIQWTGDSFEILTNDAWGPPKKAATPEIQFDLAEINFFIEFEGERFEAKIGNSVVGLGLKSTCMMITGAEGGFGDFLMDLNGMPFPSRLPIGVREDFVDGCALVLQRRPESVAKRSGET